ncbi:hypothetical protein L195_g051910 [Trifolium pratense]|uniref:Uncharacterized protein n=1 Tax=Trifolium pratense TaxID=57577 RepID=A0A2K3K276_TRIPR|nr:hypothetical protein L195_g051910 [Trifolium pratense]
MVSKQYHEASTTLAVMDVNQKFHSAIDPSFFDIGCYFDHRVFLLCLCHLGSSKQNCSLSSKLTKLEVNAVAFRSLVLDSSTMGDLESLTNG